MMSNPGFLRCRRQIASRFGIISPSQGFTPASMCAHAVASTCRTISPSSSPKAQSKPEFLGFFVIPPLLTKASGVQPGSSKFMSYVRCAPLLNLS
jgi:hypothetical protein